MPDLPIEDWLDQLDAQLERAPKFFDEYVRRLNEFMGAIRNPEVLAECVAISKHAMGREYYKALMLCRKLMEYEDEKLSHVASGLPKGG